MKFTILDASSFDGVLQYEYGKNNFNFLHCLFNMSIGYVKKVIVMQMCSWPRSITKFGPQGGPSPLCYVTACVQRVFLMGLFTSSFGFREPIR